MHTRITKRSSFHGKVLAMSKDGELLVRKGENNLFLLRKQGEQIIRLVHSDPTACVAFDDTGDRLFMLTAFSVRVYAPKGTTDPVEDDGLQTQPRQTINLEEEFGDPTAITFLPAINCMAIGNKHGTVRILTLEEGYELKTIQIGCTVERIDAYHNELLISGTTEIFPFDIYVPETQAEGKILKTA